MTRFSEKVRYGTLGALLALTLFAAAVPGQDEDDIVEAVVQPARAPADPGGAAKQSPRIALDKLNRPRPQDPPQNLFVNKSWYVAPPPPPPVAYVPPPPPAPTAPPLPFSYMER